MTLTDRRNDVKMLKTHARPIGSERRRQVVIEQTPFLSIVFLRNEFKLENIYSGVSFCVKNVCGNFYSRKRIFADHCREKSHKLEPAKILCHTENRA